MLGLEQTTTHRPVGPSTEHVCGQCEGKEGGRSALPAKNLGATTVDEIAKHAVSHSLVIPQLVRPLCQRKRG